MDSELRALELFTGLTDEQLGQLAAAGTEREVAPGEVAFTEGHPADVWWVLLDGALELSRGHGRERAVVGLLDVPGRWAGGFRAWDPEGVYLATATGVRAARLLTVPAAALRDLYAVWSPFGAHLVRGVYGTARSIESTARQRESLFALGALAAGLAHNINNPAAAAVRAVGDLEAALAGIDSALGALAAADLTAAHFRALGALHAELRPPAAPPGALQVADLEDELADRLDVLGVERAWEVAPALVAGGADAGWLERVAAALPAAEVGPAVAWVAGRLTAAALVADVKEATGRVSGLVAAVRSYSQMDRAAVQLTHVAEGLDAAVAVLGDLLGDRITVVRDYAEVPAIEAYAGELNQVWTNLLDNAADAMPGGGTLTLGVAPAGEQVAVRIADTGGGMPPEVAARAFEPFFTTKPPGEGAGLGLDIARRIVVERHGGTITATSTPAGTTLDVMLPITPRHR